MTIMTRAIITATVLAACASDLAVANDASLKLAPARQGPAALHSMILDATFAGKRIVAVGERGAVLLSDDGGATFRQAASVPVDTTLTAVSFAGERNGWAVGHGSVVLHTADGGEHWELQHQDLSVDQPLFSVHFRDKDKGWAIGLWSLMLVTTDGGKSWARMKLSPPEGQKRADVNLMHIFEGPGGKLYVAAEQGLVLVSDPAGQTWRFEKTGGLASLWAGASGQGGALLGGLRGKTAKTVDGTSWQPASAPTEASITHIVRAGQVYFASALNGAVLSSRDEGATWQLLKQYGKPVTAMLPLDEQHVLAFSKQGPMRD